MNKFLSPVRKGFIIIVFFLFVFGLIVISIIRKPAKISELPVTPTPAPALSYPVLMEKTLNFIQSQYRDDGFYNYFANYQKLCRDSTDPNSCPLGEKNMIEQANMWVILARLSYFSKDPQQLLKAETDAQALLKYCRQDLNRCLLTIIPLSELYAETKKEEYGQVLKDIGGILVKKDSQKVMQLGYYSRGLARLYKIFADDEYFIASREMLAKAEAASKANESKYGRDGEICYLIAAKTEMIETADDRQSKSEVTDFFQKDQEKQVPKQLTLIQPCIESAFRLGQYLNDEKMNVKARQMLDEYVTGRWNGAGGFYMAESKDITNITDTAYMVYLMGYGD